MKPKIGMPVLVNPHGAGEIVAEIVSTHENFIYVSSVNGDVREWKLPAENAVVGISAIRNRLNKKRQWLKKQLHQAQYIQDVATGKIHS